MVTLSNSYFFPERKSGGSVFLTRPGEMDPSLSTQVTVILSGRQQGKQDYQAALINGVDHKGV